MTWQKPSGEERSTRHGELELAQRVLIFRNSINRACCHFSERQTCDHLGITCNRVAEAERETLGDRFKGIGRWIHYNSWEIIIDKFVHLFSS